MSGPGEALDYRAVFEALSDSTRLRILFLILSVENELPCAALDDILPVSKPTISYHVKTLRKAHLIAVEKRGRRYYYRLQFEVFARFLPGLISTLEEARRRLGSEVDRTVLDASNDEVSEVSGRALSTHARK